MAITFWGYPNGQIPLDKMYAFTSMGTTYYLREDAAYWWWRLATAFSEATGVALEIVDAYRTLDEQWFYWDRYINRKPGWTVASEPGKSNHGWAMAVDIYGPSYGGSTSSHLHAWLRANAPAYGWTWTTGQASGEPWHWEFTNVPTRPAGEGFEPIEEIDMTAEANIIKEIRTSEDRLRREDRPRLYSCTEHADEFIIVNENLPSGDPGKIAYPRNAGQITSLELNYQFVADDVAQAQMRTHKQLETIIALARGYDSVFTPSGNFA